MPTWMARAGLVSLALSLLLGGCSGKPDVPSPGEEATEPPWFEDITDRVGLNFVHDPGPVNQWFMPQIVGSGAAIFDADGDGLLDLYLLQNAGPKSGSVNRLYRQLPGGRFEDISAASGLDIAGHNMGVAVGDINNDGRPDVVVTQFGGVRLFLNLGGGKFRDISKEAGVSSPQWGVSAAFFDYDRDGWLDLIVVNYVDYDPTWPCTSPSGIRDFCAPSVFSGTVSRLWHNRGPNKDKGSTSASPVTFEDVTLSSGIGKFAAPGLGVVCADFTGDDLPDLFVANDGKPNHLWINQGNGTFTEEAVARGVAYTYMGQAFAGMGIALGDVDNDDLLDLYVTHLTSETNTLWRQGPRGLFKDQTAGWGLNAMRWRGTGFGALLGDFDQDGWLDLAIVNGRVQRGGSARNTGLPTFWEPYSERNQLFVNAGQGQFRDISLSNPAFCGHHNVGRGLAVADIDRDGALDLLVTSIGGKARLFRNVAPTRGHWLKVRAFDPRWQRDAYGAEVRIRAGEKHWLRLVQAACSYACSNEPIAHFGLGTTDRIDGIEVRWPDGTRESFPGGEVDRALELRKGSGKPGKP